MNERKDMDDPRYIYTVVTYESKVFRHSTPEPYYVLSKIENDEIIFSTSDIIKLYAYCFIHNIPFDTVEFV